jgi:hypothetical protein
MRFSSDNQRRAVFANLFSASNRFAEKIYHVGKKGVPPNVEDLSRRDFGRDTGYLGTGVYGYKTKDPINYRDDIEVEELTLEKPLNVGMWFHDYVRDVSRGAFYPEKKYDGYGFEDRARLLSSVLRESGVDVPVDEIKEEFLRDANDIDNRKNTRGREQAITRILKKRGYDGIIPDSQTGNYCGVGCIKYLSDEELQNVIKRKKDPNVEEDGLVFTPVDDKFSFKDRKLKGYYPDSSNLPMEFPTIVRNVAFNILGRDRKYITPTDDAQLNRLTGDVCFELDKVWRPEWGIRPSGEYLKADVKDAWEDLD